MPWGASAMLVLGLDPRIAQTILDKKADYVLALKGNQGSLCEDVALFATEQTARGFADTKPRGARRW